MEDSDFGAFVEYLQGVVFRALQDMPLALVLAGMSRHVQLNRFTPPTAASIRECALGCPEDRAREAYGIVTQALRRINSGESVRFRDPCIHWALSQGCGGWTGFAKMSADKAQEIFEKYYISALRLGKKWGDDGVPDHLAGKREIDGSILRPWKAEQVINVAQLTQPAATKRLSANSNMIGKRSE